MDERVMEEVRRQVERTFDVATTVRRSPERPSDTLDRARGQHSSTGILRWLVTVTPGDGAKLVAITDRDLFIPVLTFVFGEAKLDGGIAVVSTARLGGVPGKPVDPRLFVSRLVKECIHELGHAFGLLHCAEARCVMARSASLLHVDAKGSALCRDCRIRLRELQQGGSSHGQ